MSKEKKAAPEAERETKAPDPAEDGAQDAQECVSEDGAAVQTEIDDLQKQLEAAKKQSDVYLNMAQRVQADFENFRRRNNAVRADAYEDGARAFIKTILPVMDNLERALAAESADAARMVSMPCVVYRIIICAKPVETIPLTNMTASISSTQRRRLGWMPCSAFSRSVCTCA